MYDRKKAKKLCKTTFYAIALLFRLRERKSRIFMEAAAYARRYNSPHIQRILEENDLSIFSSLDAAPESVKTAIKNVELVGLGFVPRSLFADLEKVLARQQKLLNAFYDGNSEYLEDVKEEVDSQVAAVNKLAIPQSEKTKLESPLLGVQALLESIMDNLEELSAALDKQMEIAQDPPHDFSSEFLMACIEENKIFIDATEKYGHYLAELHTLKVKMKVGLKTVQKTMKASVGAAKWGMRSRKNILIPGVSGTIAGITSGTALTGLGVGVASLAMIYLKELYGAIRYSAPNEYRTTIEDMSLEALGRPLPDRNPKFLQL